MKIMSSQRELIIYPQVRNFQDRGIRISLLVSLGCSSSDVNEVPRRRTGQGLVGSPRPTRPIVGQVRAYAIKAVHF
jgi:hypothetical protein